MTSEDHLSVALRVVADSTETPPPPVAELIRRGRRARSRNRAMVAAGVVAAVGGTTALTVVALGPQPAPVTAAAVDVASAPQATSDSSFRITHTAKVHKGRGVACQGAVDPGAEVGWEKGTGSDRYEIRFVDGVQYVKEAGRAWRAEPRSPSLEQSLSCGTSITGYTVDPVVVVRSLKAKGQVKYTGRTGSGQNAVDTYRFSYSIKNGLLTYSGVVSAGVTSRHVQKVTLNLSGDGQRFDSTTVFSGFGEPVRVTAPIG